MYPFGSRKSASLPVYVSKLILPASHSWTNWKQPALAQTPILALEITALVISAAPWKFTFARRTVAVARPHDNSSNSKRGSPLHEDVRSCVIDSPFLRT